MLLLLASVYEGLVGIRIGPRGESCSWLDLTRMFRIGPSYCFQYDK